MQKTSDPRGRLANPGVIRAARLIDAALVTTAIAFAAVFIWIVAQRLAYPYGLEWLEGAMLQHARRAAAGLPLYVTPGADYTPFIYPPMFAWLGAAFVWLGPPGLLPVRFMSLAATLVTAALLFRLARGETGSRFAGAVSAALYIAMYRLSGAWYDIARTDALYVALLFGGLLAARRAKSAWHWVVAAALFAAATLTKHPAFLVAAAIGADAALRGRRAGLVLPLVAGAILLAVGLALETSTGGWFSFYIFTLPVGDSWSPETLLNVFVKDLLGPLPIAIAAAIGGLFLRWMRGREWRFWIAVLLVTTLGSAWTRAHVGGSPNTLMPVFAMLSLLGGIAFGDARVWARSLPGDSAQAARALAGLGALIQFACLVYTPGAFVPAARDRAMNVALARRMSEAGGRVFAPYDDTLAYLTGNGEMANASAIENVDRNETPQAAAMRVSLDQVIASKRYVMIIWDYPPWTSGALDGEYTLVDVIPARAGQAPLGWHAGDRRVYVLR